MAGLVALRRYKLYEPRNPRYRHSSPNPFRVAAVHANRSERKVSTLCVEMCLVQQSNRFPVHHCYERPYQTLKTRVAKVRFGSLRQLKCLALGGIECVVKFD